MKQRPDPGSQPSASASGGKTSPERTLHGAGRNVYLRDPNRQGIRPAPGGAARANTGAQNGAAQKSASPQKGASTGQRPASRKIQTPVRGQTAGQNAPARRQGVKQNTSSRTSTPQNRAALQRKSRRAGNTSSTSSANNARTRQAALTPAEAARRREIERQRRQQAERERLRKKQEAKQRRRERRALVRAVLEKAADFLKNVAIGAAIAVPLFLLIAFCFYRSLTQYKAPTAKREFALYDYIDPDDADAEKKLKKRESGDEKPFAELSGVTFEKEDGVYLPFLAVKDFFGFTLSGDADSRTVMVGASQSEFGSDNTAVFYPDSKDVRVNGAFHTLGACAKLTKDELYIPYAFFTTFVKGVSVESQRSGKSDSLRFVKNAPTVYFGASSNAPLEAPMIGEMIPDAFASHTYGVDLSAYEPYINPPIRDAYLLLVNAQHRLSASYVPDDLVDVIYTRKGQETQQMRKDAAMALEAFLSAAYIAGYTDVTVTSGYRSYAYQESIFKSRLDRYRDVYGDKAEEKTAGTTAYPGASEHQSGLACDMHNLSGKMQTFANTPAFKWLNEHCADFGFILRYPLSKTDVTGIQYEPWHFRFVGRYHAQKIMASGLSLEEYVASLEES